MLSIKDVFFLVGFVCLMMLTLLLGESFVGLIIIGLFSLFLVLTTPWTQLAQSSRYSWLIISWSIFLGLVVISTMASTSIPFSLNSLVFYFFSYGFLVYWLAAKQNQPLADMCVSGLILIGLALVGNSLFFSLMPGLQSLLPDMNLLAAVGGHNHLAAYVLLILPLTWHLAFKANSKWWFAIPLIFTMSVVLSFGRVATVLGLLQLGMIAVFYRERWQKITWLPVVMALAFLSVLGLKVFFSMQTMCPANVAAAKFCKPIGQELRGYYWEQALLGLRERPITGFGPGTFRLVSQKYRQVPYALSSFAHNAYLQMFVEVGVGGGIVFLGMMMGVGVAAWRALKREPGLVAAAGLGVLTLLVNVFFDFDWSFLGIFIATLFLASLVVMPDKGAHRALLEKYTKLSYMGTQLVVIGLAGVYCVTTLLLYYGQTSTVVKWFPYFSWHESSFKKQELGEVEKERLAEVYGRTPSWLVFLSGVETDPAKKNEYLVRGLEQDPWSVLSADPVSYYLSVGDWAGAEQKWQQTHDFLSSKRDTYGFYKESIDFGRKHPLATQALTLGIHAAEQGDGQKAGEYLRHAYYYDEWALAPENTGLMEAIGELPAAEQLTVLREIEGIPIEHFGDNRVAMGELQATLGEL